MYIYRQRERERKLVLHIIVHNVILTCRSSDISSSAERDPELVREI